MNSEPNPEECVRSLGRNNNFIKAQLPVTQSLKYSYKKKTKIIKKVLDIVGKDF